MSARNQKPLFDSQKEAAIAMHYLEQISIGDLLQQLMPTFFLIAFESLCSMSSNEPSSASLKIIKKLSAAMTQSRLTNKDHLIDLISAAEQKCVAALLLKHEVLMAI